MKIGDALYLLKEQNTAEMKILLEETLCLSKTQMLTHPEREIEPPLQKLLLQRIGELKDGRPLQYILGKWEFMGREFAVGEGVLIPREDTQALVELAGEFLKNKTNTTFADLGSGSGCIAVLLASDFAAKGYAVERSQKAYSFLKENAKQIDGSVECILGDMFSREVLEKLPQLELVVSNPPYITLEEIKSLDKCVLCEPKEALYGGDDGLYFYRKITAIYKNKLKEGGMLCFEVGFGQADAVLDILKSEGFHSPREKKDLSGIRRAVGAIK
ncbi:MAG: peptide chain release factor N(5)-glutamine methyltransferase [Oscillospiraceae bacterium]|nr:peptide chain release factor N(5)-glutamine methyltransferase [Oscillospiraceae bacterium]